MAALDLLGRRWALRILWELRTGAHTFRSLREACEDVSPSVLNARLRELREARLIARSESGYELTNDGRALGRALEPLDRWSRRWQQATGSDRKP